MFVISVPEGIQDSTNSMELYLRVCTVQAKHTHRIKTNKYLFFLFLKKIQGLFCSSGCPGTHSAEQAVLNLTEIRLPRFLSATQPNQINLKKETNY